MESFLSEEWRDIPGYEGDYEVSNTGLVRSVAGKTTVSNYKGKARVRTWEQRILKEKNPGGRDVRVSLWKDGKEKSFLVHQLVAKAFIPNPEGHSVINHIDGNPRNNNVSNLEWCDHRHNNNHAFDNGLMTTNKVTALVNKETGERHEFRSLAKASQFLGRNDGYLSGVLKKGRREVSGYTIEV